MTTKRSGKGRFVSAVVAATALGSAGGCTPVDAEQIGEFLRDLLLNALAAFLL